MQGLERLEGTKSRQVQGQKRLTDRARATAAMVATTIGEEVTVTGYAVVKAGSGYVMTRDSTPHPQWGYQDSVEFAKAVSNGLLDLFSEAVDGLRTVDEGLEAVVSPPEPKTPAVRLPTGVVIQHNVTPENGVCKECGTEVDAKEIARLTTEVGKRVSDLPCPGCHALRTLVPLREYQLLATARASGITVNLHDPLPVG